MAQLDASNAHELIHSVDAFLFDCDGVLWEGAHVIKGAVETLAYLRQIGKKIVFVSNNSTKSREALLAKIKSFGIHAYKEEVVGTAYAVAAYLQSIGFDKKVHVLGEAGIGEELQEMGILYNGIEEFSGIKTLEEAEDIVVDPEIGAVVVGLDTHLNYYKLAYANFCLQRIPGCLYIATNTDNTLPGRRGVMLPGGGTMAAALSLASNRVPIVVGKPERNMMDIITHNLKLPPTRVCMVGDRLETDILFGLNGKTKTLLVFTGVATRAQMDSNEIKPDYYTATLHDLLYITDHKLEGR